MEGWSFVNLVWVPLFITILGGVFLLFLEYRTHWFARWRSSSRNSTETQDELTEAIVGESVMSIAALESPVGDWLQIAEEVKGLLERLTAEERPEGCPVVFRGIYPKGDNVVELGYCFWAFEEGNPNSLLNYQVYVKVDAEGRVIKFTREYDSSES